MNFCRQNFCQPIKNIDNRVELKNTQEKSAKHLLLLEWVLIWFALVLSIGCAIVSAYLNIAPVWRILIIVFGFLNLFVCVYFGIIIETNAGYYKCKHCKHKYIPTYSQVVWSMHMGRTRFMKCPKCGKKSWQKKVISKD